MFFQMRVNAGEKKSKLRDYGVLVWVGAAALFRVARGVPISKLTFKLTSEKKKEKRESTKGLLGEVDCLQQREGASGEMKLQVSADGGGASGRWAPLS